MQQQQHHEEEETSLWNESYQKLRTSLPITYRIHESNPLSAFIVKLLSLIDNDNDDTDDDDDRLIDSSLENGRSMM